MKTNRRHWRRAYVLAAHADSTHLTTAVARMSAECGINFFDNDFFIKRITMQGSIDPSMPCTYTAARSNNENDAAFFARAGQGSYAKWKAWKRRHYAGIAGNVLKEYRRLFDLFGLPHAGYTTIEQYATAVYRRVVSWQTNTSCIGVYGAGASRSGYAWSAMCMVPYNPKFLVQSWLTSTTFGIDVYNSESITSTSLIGTDLVNRFLHHLSTMGYDLNRGGGIVDLSTLHMLTLFVLNAQVRSLRRDHLAACSADKKLKHRERARCKYLCQPNLYFYSTGVRMEQLSPVFHQFWTAQHPRNTIAQYMSNDNALEVYRSKMTKLCKVVESYYDHVNSSISSTLISLATRIAYNEQCEMKKVATARRRAMKMER